jgi:hypothetical protein
MGLHDTRRFTLLVISCLVGQPVWSGHLGIVGGLILTFSPLKSDFGPAA